MTLPGGPRRGLQSARFGGRQRCGPNARAGDFDLGLTALAREPPRPLPSLSRMSGKAYIPRKTAASFESIRESTTRPAEPQSTHRKGSAAQTRALLTFSSERGPRDIAGTRVRVTQRLSLVHDLAQALGEVARSRRAGPRATSGGYGRKTQNFPWDQAFCGFTCTGRESGSALPPKEAARILFCIRPEGSTSAHIQDGRPGQ